MHVYTYAEDRDDDLLEAPEPGDNIDIHKGLVFNDLVSLKRW